MTSPTPSTTGNTLIGEILKQIPQAHCTDDCDGNGTYSDTDMNGEQVPAQCEYCYVVRFPAVDAILDVVIQALPKIVNDLDTIAEKNKHLPSRLQQSTLAESSGYIKAITEVTSLLEQAKSK